MLVVDMLLASATGNVILGYIDGHSGYNQIFITNDDISKTTFRYPRSLRTYGCLSIYRIQVPHIIGL